jgi:DNA polymerase III subunit gamma/tau
MAEESKATGATQALALYRKYRPATFAEVRGQEHVTEPLRQALRSGRINHAYLFSGPRGCGKTSSARILARSLNCVHGPTPDPCGECDSCVALAPSGPGSIDVIEIDAASHGGVDDARELRERAFYAPVAGRYKIYIIDEAHMVTQQGFNALLKLVEEPPPHLKFIFATTEPEKVIPTIRSRTHHYPFRLMPPSVMRELAEEILGAESVPFDPAVLPLVVRAGGGSARDTLSILDQLLAGSDADGIRYDRAVALLGYTDATLLDEIVDAFAAADGAAVFAAVNRVIEGGHEPRRFALDMLDRFRDLIVLASVPDAITTGLLDVPPDRAEALTGQARRYGLAALTRAAEIVAAGLDQMRGATSPRLLLELLCAQVLLPGAATDERSVLARIERLEAGNVRFEPATVTAPARAVAGAGPADSERTVDAPAAPAPADGGEPATAAAPASPPPAVAQREDTPPEPGGPESASTGQAQPPAAPGGPVTTETLVQRWPQVLAAINAKRRVAGMIIGNASVVSFDENVLTLRFPRQGDVKGFQSGRYEDLLKEVLGGLFGISVAVRAISGGDPGPGPRRPGPAPAPGAPSAGGPPAAPTRPPAAPGPASPGHSAGQSVSTARPSAGQSAGGEVGLGQVSTAASGSPAGAGGDMVAATSAPAAPGGGAGTAGPFGTPDFPRGDLPPLPPPPPLDDEDFDPDDEDMSMPVANELTGMALVQRELGAQIIAEYED